jgi:hypothetical protein
MASANPVTWLCRVPPVRVEISLPPLLRDRAQWVPALGRGVTEGLPDLTAKDHEPPAKRQSPRKWGLLYAITYQLI